VVAQSGPSNTKAQKVSQRWPGRFPGHDADQGNLSGFLHMNMDAIMQPLVLYTQPRVVITKANKVHEALMLE
jgi:hypothetical protein